MWNIIGHEWAVNLLSKQIARGRIHHAYLITGPSGVGRRTLALRIAQALNCTQPPRKGNPCLKCHTCTQIFQMAFPDLAIIQAEQRAGTIKVDQVRQIQRSLVLAPYSANYRVAIFLRFEETSKSAANALLKTLEEPAAQVVLILTAESAQLLPPTIVSRCEILRLRPLPTVQINQWLQESGDISPEESLKLAHLSSGKPGTAIKFLESPHLLSQRNKWLDEHINLLSTGRIERFTYAESISRPKDRLQEIISIWLTLWRDVLINNSGSVISVSNLNHKNEIEQLSSRLNQEEILHTVTKLENTLTLLDKNVNPRLAAEVMMLDLPLVRV